MTIVEFIKSQLYKDTELGDLAKDIQRDNEFPVDKTEEEIISYLDFKTMRGGTNSVFKSFLKAYEIQKDTEVDQFDLDTRFALLRTETWKFYKENFHVDKVILIGQHSDLYKAYCIDTTINKALFFDIKSNKSLNNISMVEEETIPIGNFTEQVSVAEAITMLENCTYDTPIKPGKDKISKLLAFLKINLNR